MQTIAAEKTYYKMRLLSAEESQEIIDNCWAYLKKHPDERLSLRLSIFEAHAKRETKIFPDSNDFRNVFELLPKCLKLGDDQITAELYAIISDYATKDQRVSYVLKANTMMENIGVQYFPRYRQRLYDLGYVLYLNQEFKQALNYLKEANKICSSDMHFLFNPSYVLVNDLTAACYRELKYPDSSMHHTKLVLQNLELAYNQHYKYVDFWKSITKGNLAYQLIIDGKINNNLDLLYRHKEAALKNMDYNNAAIVENRLGEIYLLKGSKEESLKAYRAATYYGKKSRIFKQRKVAAKGLLEIYRKSQISDSVYKYFALYKSLEDSTFSSNLAYNLGNAEAKLAFESTERSLNSANFNLKQQRLFRNFIIIFILIVSIVSYQFYSRTLLAQRSKNARLESDKSEALIDAEKAREEIHIFKQKIIEKEALISKLHSHILDKEDVDPVTEENVIKYTLIDKDEMEKFNFEFDIANPTVMPRLDKVSKPLSPAERRLAALIYLQLNNEQIGHALGISKDSVARSKRRLKQTLQLGLMDSLEEFVLEK